MFTGTGGSPDTLQEAQVLALSQADCEDFYADTPYDIFDDMICVGHDEDDYTGACYVRLLSIRLEDWVKKMPSIIYLQRV